MSGNELELRAVLEWQENSSTYVTHYSLENEGLASLIPGTTIQASAKTRSAPAPWTELPGKLPPRAPQAGGKRRFLVLVEEAQPSSSLGVENVLAELSKKYSLQQPAGVTADGGGLDQFLAEHLGNLGLITSVKDPLFRELKDNFIRGLAITLGSHMAAEKLMNASTGGTPQPGSSHPPEKKVAGNERLVRPATVYLYFARNLQSQSSGESLKMLQALWEGERLLSSERTGVLVPKFVVKLSDLPDNHVQLVINGVGGKMWHYRAEHFVFATSFEAETCGYLPVSSRAGECLGFWAPSSEIANIEARGLKHSHSFVDLLMLHLRHELPTRCAELLTFEQAASTLVSYQEQATFKALVPDLLDRVSLWRLLRTMAEEGLTVRHLGPIFDALLVDGCASRDLDKIYEKLRLTLRPALAKSLWREDSREPVLWALPSLYEDEILEGRLSQELLEHLSVVSARMLGDNRPLNVLAAPTVRREFVKLFADVFPGVRAFTAEELRGQSYGLLQSA